MDVVDGIAIIILIFATLILKIFINDLCYKILRKNHSKTYIRKNCSGVVNWLTYKDYRKEVGLIFYINLLILIVIAFSSILFILRMFINLNINFILKIFSGFFGALCVIDFVYIIAKFLVTGIDGRGDKVGVFSRFIMLLLAIVMVILVFR